MDLNQDYFSLLELPRAYQLDRKQLKSQARKLLREYHPDRFSAATPEEKRLAEQLTAHINHAVSVLEEPVSRLKHLLSLAGVDANFDNRTINDAGFLMQQMELREAFDDAVENDGRGIDALAEQVTQSQASLEQRFQQVDFGDQATVQNMQEALLADFAKLHFFLKLNAELKAAARAQV